MLWGLLIISVFVIIIIIIIRISIVVRIIVPQHFEWLLVGWPRLFVVTPTSPLYATTNWSLSSSSSSSTFPFSSSPSLSSSSHHHYRNHQSLNFIFLDHFLLQAPSHLYHLGYWYKFWSYSMMTTMGHLHQFLLYPMSYLKLSCYLYVSLFFLFVGNGISKSREQPKIESSIRHDFFHSFSLGPSKYQSSRSLNWSCIYVVSFFWS